jgi:class 3 adenylate cyclase
MNLEESIAAVDRRIKSGDLMRAYDEASTAIEHFPESETLKHKALLALARAGATERAARLFREWGLDRSESSDVLSIEARLAKDRALRLAGAKRRAGLLESAEIYRRINEKKANYYQAINWASLTFLGGRHKAARAIAKRVLADPEIAAAAGYWPLATRAEAHLVLGETDRARADLKAARRTEAAEVDRASTRKQLRLILAESGHKPAEIEALLSPLAPRATLHFIGSSGTGHGFGAYRGAANVTAALAAIEAALAKHKPGAVFGSLGNPAEILFAEAALAAGVELNVILPLPEPIFERLFLAEAGEDWRRRFRECCAKAARLERASEDPDSEDRSLGDYAASVAMGLALLRAQNVDGKALQLVLRDSTDPPRPALAEWTADKARRQVTVPLRDKPRRAAGADKLKPRRCCAVIFGDLPGFSKLPERYLPVFWATVMQAIGDVVAENKEAVALRNTWGDAIHFIISDAPTAAEICLTMQRRLAVIDGRVLGRDEPPTMRVGAHYGPVFEGWDPIAGEQTYYGRSLSRAARIEPITPPGTVYVTEAFAAILLLQSNGEFTCTYVGQVPLAKGFGTFRMYDLAPVAGTEGVRRQPLPSKALSESSSPRKAAGPGKRQAAGRRSRP